VNEERNKILALIRKILRGYPEVRAAYLFGSRAEGYERKTSDIDIAVLIDEKLDTMKAFSLQLELGDMLERKLQRPMDLVVLNQHASDPCLSGVERDTFFRARPRRASPFRSENSQPLL